MSEPQLHKCYAHRVWQDSHGRFMCQVATACGKLGREDLLVDDFKLATCFECLTAPLNPRVVQLILLADGEHHVPGLKRRGQS